MTQERIVTRWRGWGMLAVLCGEQSVSPLVNTEALYN